MTSARYLSTAMAQTVTVAALIVIGTTALPAKNLQMKSPKVLSSRTFFSAKSYIPGQIIKVIRSATAKFIRRKLVVVCIEGVFRTIVITTLLAGTPMMMINEYITAKAIS